jgi:purine-binding chemotaxis protein CheW
MINTSVRNIWVLRLGSSFIGVEPKAFKEVLEVTQPTPVPLAPPPLLGLMNNQGQIVPVFDLSQVLQITPAGSGIAALLECEGRLLAFMIDEVIGLSANLSGAWITPSPDPLYSAIMEEGGRSVRILEAGSLFLHLSRQMSSPAPAAHTGLAPQA